MYLTLFIVMIAMEALRTIYQSDVLHVKLCETSHKNGGVFATSTVNMVAGEQHIVALLA